MRLLSARLLIALILGITLTSLSFSYYQALSERRNMRRDVAHRAEILAESLAGSVEHDLQRNSMRSLRRTVDKFANREHLLGVAIYDPQNNLIVGTDALAQLNSGTLQVVGQALQKGQIGRASCRERV